MSVTSHLTELRKKHEHLSAQVEEAQRRPASDDLALAKMKKMKLALKEQITRLSPQ
ncbi:YdcH family protein [Pseudoroseicyclus sp. H15]